MIIINSYIARNDDQCNYSSRLWIVKLVKTNGNYNEFFQKLFEQDNFQPESIMTDFESGTIKAVKEMLLTCYTKVSSTLLIEKRRYKYFLTGCLFHFSRAVWRQVQSKGLATKYRQDECFRLNVKN